MDFPRQSQTDPCCSASGRRNVRCLAPATTSHLRSGGSEDLEGRKIAPVARRIPREQSQVSDGGSASTDPDQSLQSGSLVATSSRTLLSSAKMMIRARWERYYAEHPEKRKTARTAASRNKISKKAKK